MKLRIGKISYTNLFPIFYTLEQECDCSEYEFIEGSPSELNRKIREGAIDISPSSSIEYIRHPELYDLLENHSISSTGAIGSILLFSRRPIETLKGFTILTSSQSETSVALLKIIMRKFLEIRCTFASSSEKIGDALQSETAYMLIGDEALAESRNWPQLFIYDLGELWQRHTGLPFTFALWISRKDSYKENPLPFETFRVDLDRAKSSSLHNLRSIAASAPARTMLGEEKLVSYWKCISYDFGESHVEGYELFKQYAEELGLI